MGSGSLKREPIRLLRLQCRRLKSGIEVAAGISDDIPRAKQSEMLYENLTKLMLEDVKLLHSIGEGILYGYVMNNCMVEMRSQILSMYKAKSAVNSLESLVEQMFKDELNRRG